MARTVNVRADEIGKVKMQVRSEHGGPASSQFDKRLYFRSRSLSKHVIIESKK